MSKKGRQIVELIKNDEIKKVSTDIIEGILDSKMAEGVLKEIPLLSSIVGAYNAFTSIQDKLFLKKLFTFLHELSSVPQDERVKQIIKIEDDSTYKTKVGEKLLFMINKADDLDKASMIGRLFKAYLESKISYDEFLACVSCIERAPLPDLITFIQNDWDELGTDDGGSEFVAYGLMEIRLTRPKVKLKRDSGFDYDKYAPSEEEELENKIELIGFDALCYVNHNGKILRNYLWES